MATVVVGTAGHIDHGKTTLLRALTGIDADRLPEERRRGMTIDVGFAHLAPDDGEAIDFVDVPGHDRLVGNMLVGAGEIDAVLLVVAADDGPRPQTLEHLELLDALGLRDAIVAITKADVATSARLREVEDATREFITGTGMASAPIVAVSAITGTGIDELRERLIVLRDSVGRELAPRHGLPMRLPIDRVFAVKGRGVVVTGTLRGSVAAGDVLRLEPAGRSSVRVREVQVRHGSAPSSSGGRTALNLAGIGIDELQRGDVLTTGAGVDATDRLLVALRRPGPLRTPKPGKWPPSGGLRLHLWTASVDVELSMPRREWPDVGEDSVAAVLRLARPAAAVIGARGVVRDPASGLVVGGITILDTDPPRGVSRRRQTPERLAGLAAALAASRSSGERGALAAALTDLHGALPPQRDDTGSSRAGLALASDVAEALTAAASDRASASDAGVAASELREELLRLLRRLASVGRSRAASLLAVDVVVDDLVRAGQLVRVGDRIRNASAGSTADTERAAAMDRLVALLDADVPPSLAEALRASRCATDALRELEASGRIVRVEDDLAWSAGRHRALGGRAVEMARLGPLSPAAFRDAIGGNRRVALALLEDFGRRGLLRRTDGGHVLGPRAGANG